MCLCLFLLDQALFRYEIGFYFAPRYVFVCSLHRPLFAFISAGLAQKDFVPRCVLLLSCEFVLYFYFVPFTYFLYSFHCFYFEQALKASALSQDLSGFILVLVVSCLLFP